MLTHHFYPNTDDLGKSREPAVSRNCENPQDAFAHHVFRRFFRLALRGEYKLLRRSRLGRSSGRHGQPALECVKRLRMDDDQRRFGQRRCDDLFLRAESRWRDTAIQALVRPVQANRLWAA